MKFRILFIDLIHDKVSRHIIIIINNNNKKKNRTTSVI